MISLPRSIRMLPAEELADAVRGWIQEQGLWWATSITAHALVLSIVMLLAGAFYVAPKTAGNAPRFESVRLDTTVADIERIDLSEPAGALADDALAAELPAIDAPIGAGLGRDEAPLGQPDVGDPTLSAAAAASWRLPINRYAAGVGAAAGGPADLPGSGTRRGIFGAGSGFGDRAGRMHSGMIGSGCTGVCLGAVAPALNWFARHQSPDGRWSLANYARHCRDATCTGHGSATQVMHNLSGPEWDVWNRPMRKILTASQITRGCAAGSWDPAAPARDTWGEQGGRIMLTSLSCLTLEVYYRYLPLYKLEGAENGNQ